MTLEEAKILLNSSERLIGYLLDHKPIRPLLIIATPVSSLSIAEAVRQYVRGEYQPNLQLQDFDVFAVLDLKYSLSHNTPVQVMRIEQVLDIIPSKPL